ncbi:lytic transglycosylase domain-containing protein [Siminovitchia sediminis]|uniref:Lytic transglycosylase domain-containing protein n=1 Tax=Siminovitchia sediminis TaxID=1274353 RepID=A0ABW4KBR8_9BACI
MNTLGHIKTLLELQSLQSFSSRPANPGMVSGTPPFASLLQELITANHLGTMKEAADQLNTLGLVFQNTFQQPAEKTVPIKKTNNAAPLHQHGSLEQIIQRAADTYNLPAKLIKSVIRHESNFDPKVVSKAGASGLMQLMPATARGLGVTDIMDPEQNVMGGSKYLRSMLDKYHGNLKLALAAYNAGPGNVDKYGGIPPFKETQNYVRRVTDTFNS